MTEFMESLIKQHEKVRAKFKEQEQIDIDQYGTEASIKKRRESYQAWLQSFRK